MKKLSAYNIFVKERCSHNKNLKQIAKEWKKISQTEYNIYQQKANKFNKTHKRGGNIDPITFTNVYNKYGGDIDPKLIQHAYDVISKIPKNKLSIMKPQKQQKSFRDLYDSIKSLSGNGIKKDIALYTYKTLMNLYRNRYCDGKARPLESGEIHPLCANYEGPGTKINKYSDYPPFNDIDNIARTHDLEYALAGRKSDRNEKEKLIREADDKFLQDIEQYKNEEPYYSMGKKGIESKNALENKMPYIVASLLLAERYGRK